MEPLGIALVLGGTAALVFLAVKAFKAVVAIEAQQKAKLDVIWAEVARRLDLRRPERFVLEGSFEGFRVRAEYLPGGESPSATKLFLSGPRIAPGVTLAREGAFAGVQKALSGEDVLTGDAAFDKAVHVKGPEDVAVAALPASIRPALMRWLGLGGKLEGGTLSCYLNNDETGPDRIPEALRELAGFAKAMAQDSVASALQATAKSDPAPAVRMRALELLVRTYLGVPACDKALSAALGDADSGVVLFAAQHQSGEKAREALVKLAMNTEAAEAHRASAVELLSQAHPWPSARACVSKALYTRGATVRHAAVRAAGKARDATLMDDLVSMLPTQDEELALALAAAFEPIGGVRAEKALVDLLTSMDSLPVKKAAAEALGRIGSIAAVEPLAALVDKGLVKDAARDAVRAIQARLGDVGAGRLSVVDPGAAGGALSLGEDGEKAKERG